VYCAQTDGAAELLNVCYERGIGVPNDLSIVGQHDTPEKLLLRPHITTVGVRALEMGHRAAEMVLRLIDREKPNSIVLKPELIVRASTLL